MKNIIAITSLIVAGTALANAATLMLSEVNDYTRIVGGIPNNAVESAEGAAFDSSNSYSDWVNTLTLENTWYVKKGYNSNVGDDYKPEKYTPEKDSVMLIAGGPLNYGDSACGAIRFSVGSEYFVGVSNEIVFSFDVCLTSKGNNKSNHEFTFDLICSNSNIGAKPALTYNSKEGNSPTLTTSDTTVSFTLSADEVQSIAAAGTNAEFVFSVATNNITGSNQGILMSDFRLDGVAAVPEPSAFGLLAGAGALALVAARRRRRTK